MNVETGDVVDDMIILLQIERVVAAHCLDDADVGHALCSLVYLISDLIHSITSDLVALSERLQDYELEPKTTFEEVAGDEVQVNLCETQLDGQLDLLLLQHHSLLLVKHPVPDLHAHLLLADYLDLLVVGLFEVIDYKVLRVQGNIIIVVIFLIFTVGG